MKILRMIAVIQLGFLSYQNKISVSAGMIKLPIVVATKNKPGAIADLVEALCQK